MLAIFIVISVYACTFVGCNERIESGSKGGFFVAYAALVAVVLALSWLFG